MTVLRGRSARSAPRAPVARARRGATLTGLKAQLNQNSNLVQSGSERVRNPDDASGTAQNRLQKISNWRRRPLGGCIPPGFPAATGPVTDTCDLALLTYQAPPLDEGRRLEVASQSSMQVIGVVVLTYYRLSTPGCYVAERVRRPGHLAHAPTPAVPACEPGRTRNLRRACRPTRAELVGFVSESGLGEPSSC